MLELLRAEIELALQLVGCRTPAEVTRAATSSGGVAAAAVVPSIVSTSEYPWSSLRGDSPGVAMSTPSLKRILVAAVVRSLSARCPRALADACGVPDATPVWVDFGGHDAPIPAKPGLVIAVASGTDVPAQIREAGAATVLFDLNLNKRVGTTSEPGRPVA